MKLSRLVFNAVKQAKQLPNANEFEYSAFKQGKYNEDPDYALTISNIMTPINMAIHRLSDLHKIKNKIEELPNPNDLIIDYSNKEYANKIKNIVNVVNMNDKGQWTRIGYREFGVNKLLLTTPFFVGGNYHFYIEYREDIPNFTLEDIDYNEDNEEITTSGEHGDVELKDYGINETMCSYITEFAVALVMETVEPSLANAHRAYAEQAFANLDDQTTSFYQRKVNRVHRM